MDEDGLDKSPRSYFRLEYPHEDRPVLCINRDRYPIINLCERGVKFGIFSKETQAAFALDDEVAASIVFHDASSTKIEGKILRVDSDALVILLSEGIPLQRIMVEQRFLLGKYGNLKRPFVS